MKIGIIGTGYVGLVTGVMMTALGHEVKCIDKDREKVKNLKLGNSIIYEAGLEQKLRAAIKNEVIGFFCDYSSLKDVEAVFICVGTPSKLGGEADLSYVYDAIDEIMVHINIGCLLIIKSTVPPGTCLAVREYISSKNLNFSVASNPEFLREGCAVYDFENPDRIIIGGDNHSFEVFQRIYKPQIDRKIPVVMTDTTTAELIKYTSNSFLAVKLSFINEISDLCEKIGANIDVLSEGVGLDKRIGSLFLKVGPGYGGSCFPKDTLALKDLAKKNHVGAAVLEAAIESNINRYKLMKDKVLRVMHGAKIITIFGASFKAGTDDLRESPAIHIIRLLAKEGIRLNVYDPAAHENFNNLNINNSIACKTYIEACTNSDGIVVLTEWPEFNKLDFEKIASVIKAKIILDLRKIIDEKSAIKYGFKYFTVGRKL